MDYFNAEESTCQRNGNSASGIDLPLEMTSLKLILLKSHQVQKVQFNQCINSKVLNSYVTSLLSTFDHDVDNSIDTFLEPHCKIKRP